jgi:hypothetical protein
VLHTDPKIIYCFSRDLQIGRKLQCPPLAQPRRKPTPVPIVPEHTHISSIHPTVMSFSKVFTTLSILLAVFFSGMQPASADIVSISTQGTAVHVGQSFNVTLTTADNGQNSTQYYAVFGITASDTTDQLGTVLGSGYDLISNVYNQVDNGSISVPLTIPSSFQSSACNPLYQIVAAIYATVSIPHKLGAQCSNMYDSILSHRERPR